MNRVLRLTLLAAGLLTVSITAWSQDAPAKLDKADKSDKADRKPVEPKDTVRDTSHKITLNGQPLNYLASAGTLVLRDDDGKPLASMFFVAYKKVDGAASKTLDLWDQRKTVGRYDSRYEGGDVDAIGERPECDPSYAAVPAHEKLRRDLVAFLRGGR